MLPSRMRKISGPRTEPCGTPDMTGCGADFLPETSTVWSRPVRKLVPAAQASSDAQMVEFAQRDADVDLVERLRKVEIHNVDAAALFEVVGDGVEVVKQLA